MKRSEHILLSLCTFVLLKKLFYNRGTADLRCVSIANGELSDSVVSWLIVFWLADMCKVVHNFQRVHHN